MAQVTLQHPISRSATLEKVKKPHQLTPLRSLFAGGFAGATEACITYPFEYAKTRSQLKSSTSTPSNPIFLLRQTIAQEGFGALYTGCGALAAGTALKAGVRFMTFDAIKARLADAQGRLSTSNGILAGMSAGAVESIVAVTPTERVKTALIDDAKSARRFRSTVHGIGLLLREQGIRRGLYRGLLSTTAKQSATSAVRMGAYNAMRSQYATRFSGRKADVAETFGMGAVAGIVTVYATQPLDTIKTRSQSAQGERLGAAIIGLWQRTGLLLSGGIVFAVYEQIAGLMKTP
ncbi:Putative mitochondrial carrier domain superfamily [Septoria linicola]|uniref:Mitochondrial carrier domain superfamily n=1 Tax=Septoria linicola TaxID=215465 RepID=A0A9Q9AGN1_9PEZI|nr:putative mitochondrial carrier domain superfamily [Septoria linicola]USW48787.1 Putative mitochondrial carrier domain superfamily [Septoria linicola]